jgi:glycosyltransferase 2 family protein
LSGSPVVIAEKEMLPAMKEDAARDSGYSGTCKGSGRPEKMGFSRMIPGSLVFIFFTVGIFWYQFRRIQPGEGVPGWGDVQWGYLLLMLLCLPLETISGSLRTWVVSRVIQPGLTFWTCVKSELANIGISMLTPSQTGGGFGQIYMLKRGGADLSTALTVSLISFLGTVIGLFCVGLYLTLVPGRAFRGSFFRGTIWGFTVICLLMVLGACCPGVFRFSIRKFSRMLCWIRWRAARVLVQWAPEKARPDHPQYHMRRPASWLIDLVSNYHEGVRLFVLRGKAHLALVVLLTLTFILSRCMTAFLCLRVLGIDGANLGHVLKVQLALIILVYFAPTPGASGLAESASLTLMGSIVPVGFAPYYHILWRCTTLFLPGMAGLLCLVTAIIRDARRGGRHRGPRALELRVGQ